MASNVNILRQYLDDYSNAATKYNRAGKEYQGTLQLQGGPKVAKNAQGESFGLWEMPNGNVQRVQSGTYQDYHNLLAQQYAQHGYAANGMTEFVNDERPFEAGWGEGGMYTPQVRPESRGTWVLPESQSGNAIRGADGGYYTDVGGGLAARRTGGVGTGEFITERRGGNAAELEGLRQSGMYKDVKYIDAGTDTDGNTIGYIDVTYEKMAFPDKPGAFDKKPPSFTLQQEKALKGEDTTTMADADRESEGVIGAILNQAKKPRGAGLISGSMD